MTKQTLITEFKKHCADTGTFTDRVERLATQQQNNIRQILFEKGVIRIFNSYSPYLLFYKGATNQDMITGKATLKCDLTADEYTELETLYSK